MTPPVNDLRTEEAWSNHLATDTKLTRLVPHDTLRRIQAQFTALGEVTVCLCTPEARLITPPTWGSHYSKLIGMSEQGRVALLDAVKVCTSELSASVPSVCHEGLSLYATPIRYRGEHLATIIVGARVRRAPDRPSVGRVAKRYAIDFDDLWSAASALTRYVSGPEDATQRFADVLAEMIGALYGQARRIENQVADLDTVHVLSEMLAGTHDLQDILDRTVRRVVEVLNVKACCIRLLDQATGELVVKAVHNLSDEYLQKGPVLIHENAIDGAAFDGETVYIEDAANDPRMRYPENARREGIVSGLCVPMVYRGDCVGVLRVYTEKRQAFADSERLLLRSIASQGAAAVITGRLHREHAEAERVQRQVGIASEVQRRMLPVDPPDDTGLAFGCVYDPSLELSGDFYDFLGDRDRGIGLCIADVVGKGLPAALMMASVRSSLRSYAEQYQAPDVVVAMTNRQMYRDTLTSEFATLVYGVFSRDARKFTYSNAGHDPPLMFRGDELMKLSEGGMVIGVDPETPFDCGTVSLCPGDVLVFTTDGVFEAMSFEGQLYTRRRMIASIRKHIDLEASQLAQQILWDVRRFVGLTPQSDDITIVVVKVL